MGCGVRQTWIGISAPRLNVDINFTSMSSSVKWVNTNPPPPGLGEGENELGPVKTSPLARCGRQKNAPPKMVMS